jgi:hypothetical protein
MRSKPSAPPIPFASKSPGRGLQAESQRYRWLGWVLRGGASAALVGGYYWVREPMGEAVGAWYARAFGGALDPATPRILGVTFVLIGLIVVWWRLLKTDPRFQGPLLITSILALGDAAFNILENQTAPAWLVDLTGGRLTEYSPTFVVIVITTLAEAVLGRFFWGKWPHLASAYISGISTGILIKSPALWPFILCGLISISSKYVLRNAVSAGALLLQLALVAVLGYIVIHPEGPFTLLGIRTPSQNSSIIWTQLLLLGVFLIFAVVGASGNRHLWNPTNFGVTMMLMLAPDHVASLSVQAGNNGWAVLVIWLLGGMIMYRLGLWRIPLTFVAAFVPLAFLRSFVTSHPWWSEIAPITSPMFQLFIFFMITDPKTITRGKTKQVVVVLFVAAMETLLRLAFKDIWSLFHALFIVGPVANVIEIWWDTRHPRPAVVGK